MRLIQAEQSGKEHVLGSLTFKRNGAKRRGAGVRSSQQNNSSRSQRELGILLKDVSACSGCLSYPVNSLPGALSYPESVGRGGCVFSIKGHIEVTAEIANPTADFVIDIALADRRKQHTRRVIGEHDQVPIVGIGVGARPQTGCCACGLGSHDRLALLEGS